MEEKTIFEGKEVEIHRNHHLDGSLNCEWTQTRYDLHGYYRQYYPSGLLAKERIYRNGKKTSHDFSFFLSGKIKSYIIPMENNNFKHVSYFEDGKLQSEIIRNVDEKIVLYNKSWHNNGKLASEYFYSERGEAIGKFRQYFSDGSVNIEGEYINGEPNYHNVFKSPNEQTIMNGNGILFSNFGGEQFDLKSECQIKNGLRDGLSKTYSNGQLSSETHYIKGKAEGKSTQFNPDGTIKEFLYFEKGQFLKREKPE